MRISNRAGFIPPSPIRKLVPFAESAKAAGVTVHHLNIGQPDIPTPAVFFDAIRGYSGSEVATTALKPGTALAAAPSSGGRPTDVVLGYGHSAGLAELREAMVDYYRRLDYDVVNDDITVTTGGSEAIFFALTTLCDPGEEVLSFEPLYTNYNGFAAAASVHIRTVRCFPENGYHLPPRATIEAAITSKTRAILACSPNNPTGAVLTWDEMSMLVDIARARDLFLVVDESYRELIYGEVPHTSVMQFPAIAERVIMLDSLSKRYSVCGARIGCVVTKNRDVGRVCLHLGQARLCPPSLDQAGAVALMALGADYFRDVQREYKKRRDTVVAGLRNVPGVSAYAPEGAFYLMVGLPVTDAEHFATWLLTDFRLNHETIMVAPGEGFYTTPGLGKNEVRLAYVLDSERLERAMRCLTQGLAAYLACGQGTRR